MATALLLGALALAGCGTGYQRVDGTWAWVERPAGFARDITPLGADDATFRVLDGGRYALDAESVFFDGARIEGADADSFEGLGDLYARDRQLVVYAAHPIRGADAATFEVLAFPYARDARDVYYGTVPMHVPTPDAFEVVRASHGFMVSAVGTLSAAPDSATAVLGDTLLLRGRTPDDVVVLGLGVGAEAGAGRVGAQRYEGALPIR